MKKSRETFLNFQYDHLLEDVFRNMFHRPYFDASRAKIISKIIQSEMIIFVWPIFCLIFSEKRASSVPNTQLPLALDFDGRNTAGIIRKTTRNLVLNILIPLHYFANNINVCGSLNSIPLFFALSERTELQIETISPNIEEIICYHVFGLINVLKNSSFCGHSDEDAEDFIFLYENHFLKLLSTQFL